MVELSILYGCPGRAARQRPAPLFLLRAQVLVYSGLILVWLQGRTRVCRRARSGGCTVACMPGPGCIPLSILPVLVWLHDGLDQGVDVLARFVRTEPVGQRDGPAPGWVQQHVRPGSEVVVVRAAVGVSVSVKARSQGLGKKRGYAGRSGRNDEPPGGKMSHRAGERRAGQTGSERWKHADEGM